MERPLARGARAYRPAGRPGYASDGGAICGDRCSGTSRIPLLYTEALTDTGVRNTDWDVEQSPAYRFGVGAVRKSMGGRVKWDFHGRGFRLWLPKGPQLGRCELLLNGEKLAKLDLR